MVPRPAPWRQSLAMHFERGRDYSRAVKQLQLAGQQAVQRAAYVETISHVTTALELLKTLPDTVECAQRELSLLADNSSPGIANHQG